MLGGFIVLLVLFWPLFNSMSLLRKADENDEGNPRIKASPPDTVTYFTAVILFFYVLFGMCAIVAIYMAFTRSEAKDIFEAQYRIDKLYGACSVMAKTVLHWGLAFIVLGQDDMVSDTDFNNLHIRCQSPGDGVQGDWYALAGVAFTALFFGIITYVFTGIPPYSEGTTGAQLMMNTIM